MATATLGNCVCFEPNGSSALAPHAFGDHTSACMIPVTVVSADTRLSQNFQIPAYWGQTNAPFTGEDAQNTVTSLETQVEAQAQLNVLQTATPPTSWY